MVANMVKRLDQELWFGSTANRFAVEKLPLKSLWQWNHALHVAKGHVTQWELLQLWPV